jgi:K+-sensing histidine kinase KdpD
MGIGLVICQSIIVGHGGNITASNHPDGGAEFLFSLPTGSLD